MNQKIVKTSQEIDNDIKEMFASMQRMGIVRYVYTANGGIKSTTDYNETDREND